MANFELSSREQTASKKVIENTKHKFQTCIKREEPTTNNLKISILKTLTDAADEHWSEKQLPSYTL